MYVVLHAAVRAAWNPYSYGYCDDCSSLWSWLPPTLQLGMHTGLAIRIVGPLYGPRYRTPMVLHISDGMGTRMAASMVLAAAAMQPEIPSCMATRMAAPLYGLGCGNPCSLTYTH